MVENMHKVANAPGGSAAAADLHSDHQRMQIPFSKLSQKSGSGKKQVFTPGIVPPGGTGLIGRVQRTKVLPKVLSNALC